MNSQISKLEFQVSSSEQMNFAAGAQLNEGLIRSALFDPRYSRWYLQPTLEHAISRVQENQEEMELNGLNQILTYSDNVTSEGGGEGKGKK